MSYAKGINEEIGKGDFFFRDRDKVTDAILFLESLRRRYKIICPKLFSKSLKRQAILQTKVQVILKPIL